MSTLVVTTFSPQINWPHGGSTATLRLKYSANFTDSIGQVVLRGLFKDVPCTIAAGVLTVPQFSLITTNDAQVNQLSTCSAQFFDLNGAARDWLFQGFVIPQSLAPSCNIAALMDYNQGASLVLPPDFYLNREETTALITALLASLGFGPATNLALGMVRLSVAAADPADPEVWGTNDPLVRDALKIMGIDLDATLATPADTNVIGFDAVLGKFVAQATAIPALHKSSHQNGGVDEIDVAGLSGLLADPQIPLAHAVLHELGGLDEINVAGLSGLLADPQTPLAHAASHQNGGSDEISVAGLSGLLADGQIPLAHKTTHEAGGSDAIKLDDLAVPDDNTDLNATTSAHGLLPKLSNNAAQFLNGQGVFTTPAGAGDVVGPAASVDSEIVLFDGATGKLIKRAANSGVIIATSGVIGSTALSGVSTEFLNGTGAFSTPSGGGGGTDVLEVQVFS